VAFCQGQIFSVLIHKSPFIFCTLSFQPIAFRIQEHEGICGIGQRLFQLQYQLCTQIIEQYYALLLTGKIHHRCAKPDHRLQWLLDFTLLYIQIKRGDKYTARFHCKCIRKIISSGFILKLIFRYDVRLSMIKIYADSLQAGFIQKTDLIITP